MDKGLQCLLVGQRRGHQVPRVACRGRFRRQIRKLDVGPPGLLEFDQLLGMRLFFLALHFEPVGKPGEILNVRQRGQILVMVGGLQFPVDVGVDNVLHGVRPAL